MPPTFSRQQVELVDYDDRERVALTDDRTKSEKSDVKEKCRYKNLCCVLLFFLLLGIILSIFFLYPRTIQLCWKLQFTAQTLVSFKDDSGEYEIKIINGNYYALHLHDFRIKAYYGDRVEEKQVLEFDIGDWNIGPQTSIERNETYVHTQSWALALQGDTVRCLSLMIDKLSFNISAVMESCILGKCKDIEENNLVFVKNCPSSDGWECWDYKIKYF